MTRIIYRLLISSFILLTFTVSCGHRRNVKKIKLTKIPFELTNKSGSIPVSFGKVKAMDVDGLGNIYVLDAEDCKVYQFDVSGKMVTNWGKKGIGPAEFHNPRALSVVGDSLVYVFHDGRLDVTDLNGKSRRRVVTHSTYDVKASSDGRIIFNLQDQSYTAGYCLSVNTPDSKLIATFRESLNRKYRNNMADVGFMDLNSRDEIIYFQAFLDSFYVYDLDGKLLKQGQQNLGFTPKPLTHEKQVMLNEDVFVDKDDHVYVLRVVREDEKEGTFVKIIDEYDPNLQFLRAYELPDPISLSIGFNFISPWYHKFVKRDGQFLFFVSKPRDHLEVYVPKSLTENESKEQ